MDVKKTTREHTEMRLINPPEQVTCLNFHIETVIFLMTAKK